MTTTCTIVNKSSLRSTNISFLLSWDNQKLGVVMHMFNFIINRENLVILMSSRDYVVNFKRKLRISNNSSNVPVSGI